MGVGSNIRTLRLNAGLTQEELAKELGVARSTITQWERGWTQPRMGMVHKLAVFFGTTNSAIVADKQQDLVQSPTAVQNSRIPIDLPMKEQDAVFHTGPLTSVEYDAHKHPAKLDIPASILAQHHHARSIIITDDSMDRTLPKGMAVVFDPELAPTNGQVAVVRMEDGSLLARRWYGGSNTVMLVADSNSTHEDIVLGAGDKAKVLGVVVFAQTAEVQ